jgi:chromosome segregation ATPase
MFPGRRRLGRRKPSFRERVRRQGRKELPRIREKLRGLQNLRTRFSGELRDLERRLRRFSDHPKKRRELEEKIRALRSRLEKVNEELGKLRDSGFSG